MLATIIDLLYEANRGLTAVQGKGKLPKPQRWPRPHEAKPKKMSLRDLGRMMVGR